MSVPTLHCFLGYLVEKLSTHGWLLWIAVAVVVAILSVENCNRDEKCGVHEEREEEREEEGREEKQKHRSFAGGDASRYRYRCDRLPDCDGGQKQRKAVSLRMETRKGKRSERKVGICLPQATNLISRIRLLHWDALISILNLIPCWLRTFLRVFYYYNFVNITAISFIVWPLLLFVDQVDQV